MKRLTLFILCLSVLLGCTSCSNNETDPTAIIGLWEYPNNSQIKDYVTDVIKEDIFYKVYYQFNEDGSGCTYIEGKEDNKVNLTYTYDAEKDILTYTFENGNKVTVSCEIRGDEMMIIENENRAKLYRK